MLPRFRNRSGAGRKTSQRSLRIAGGEAGEVDLRRREVPEFSRRGRVSLGMMFHSPVQTKSVILSSRGITTGLDAGRSRPERIQPNLRAGKAVRGRSAPPPRGLESIREENSGQELFMRKSGTRTNGRGKRRGQQARESNQITPDTSGITSTGVTGLKRHRRRAPMAEQDSRLEADVAETREAKCSRSVTNRNKRSTFWSRISRLESL